MSAQLLTVNDVANHLQISPRTVYDNAQKLGGFYPHGLRVLRFKPEVIYGNMERQGGQGMTLAEEFCKQNGIEPEIIDLGNDNEIIKRYPSFSHPDEVLAVVMKWVDCGKFLAYLNSTVTGINQLSLLHNFLKDYITTKDALLEAAVEWRRK